MKTLCWIYLTSFLLVGTWHVVSSQASGGELRTYTVADGLVSPDVTAIFQDSQGYLWFGASSGGVSRFDGENFLPFTEKDGLPSGRIKKLVEDKRGHLWLLTRQGEHGLVSRYDGKTLRQITEQDGLAGGFSNVMLKDKNGNLWFANAYGLTKYDGSGFQQFGIKELQGFIGAKDGGDGRIYALFESRNGDIWLGGGYADGRKLPPFVIRYDGKAFYHFPLDTFRPSSRYPSIRAIAEDDAGNLLFGGPYVLYKYDGVSFERFDTKQPGRFSAEYMGPSLPKEHSPYIPVIYKDGSVSSSGGGGTGDGWLTCDFFIGLDSFFKDSHGKLWFNMYNFLFIWDGNQLQHFPSLNWDATKEPVPFDEKGQPYWFPGEAVFEDGSGNLWFKNENGVYRYDGTNFQPFTAGDLGSKDISVIFEDRDGTFWFGHSNGVTFFDP